MTILEIVNEKSTVYLTVTFTDKDGAAVTPTSVTWSAMDRATGNVLQAATSLSPSSSVEITISPTVNTIVNSKATVEIRVITIQATYGLNDFDNAEYEYQLKNLQGVS